MPICRHCNDEVSGRTLPSSAGRTIRWECDRCPKCEHCGTRISLRMSPETALRSIPDEDGDRIWFCNDGQVGLWIHKRIRCDYHRDTLDTLCRLFAWWVGPDGDPLRRPDITLNLLTYIQNVAGAAVLEAQHDVDDAEKRGDI